jgi:hypothetical protein
MLDSALAATVVGSPDRVRQDLDAFVEHTGADELMITAQIFDHAARLRSFEITADVHSRGPTRISYTDRHNLPVTKIRSAAES